MCLPSSSTSPLPSLAFIPSDSISVIGHFTRSRKDSCLYGIHIGIGITFL
uniref:Uncharacterized protein n=1 Tax=Anguilla anguilla TaxID=7936 RepID=A0A0E9RZ16_ANGAN